MYEKINFESISLIMISACILLMVVIFCIYNQEIEVDIKLNNIELINVSPSECWNNDFDSDICPIPKDISIKGSGRLPLSIILDNLQY